MTRNSGSDHLIPYFQSTKSSNGNRELGGLTPNYGCIDRRYSLEVVVAMIVARRQHQYAVAGYGKIRKAASRLII